MSTMGKAKFSYDINGGTLAPFAIGLLVGGALIAFGIVNYIKSTHPQIELRDESVISKEIDETYQELEKIRNERNAIDDENNERYIELGNELVNVEGKRADLEAEYYDVTNGVYDNIRVEPTFNLVPFIILGSIVIVAGLALTVRRVTEQKVRFSHNTKKTRVVSAEKKIEKKVEAEKKVEKKEPAKKDTAKKPEKKSE